MVICVVDSGIDLGHPGLDNVEIIGWFDAVNGESAPYDDQGHGTAMVGIGLPERVLEASRRIRPARGEGIDESGTGTDEGIAKLLIGVENADIISLVSGGSRPGPSWAYP